MYCKQSTVELAISKGYKQCSCSNGGYPDCICDNNVYSNVRLDDIQRWLYSKDFWISVYCDYCQHSWKAIKMFSRDVTRFDIEYNKGTDYIFNTPDDALEDGLVHALNLI